VFSLLHSNVPDLRVKKHQKRIR